MLRDPFSRSVSGYDQERSMAEESFRNCRGEVVDRSSTGADDCDWPSGGLRHPKCDEACASFIAEGASRYVGMSCKGKGQRCTTRSGTEHNVSDVFTGTDLRDVIDGLVSHQRITLRSVSNFI